VARIVCEKFASGFRLSVYNFFDVQLAVVVICGESAEKELSDNLSIP